MWKDPEQTQGSLKIGESINRHDCGCEGRGSPCKRDWSSPEDGNHTADREEFAQRGNEMTQEDSLQKDSRGREPHTTPAAIVLSISLLNTDGHRQVPPIRSALVLQRVSSYFIGTSGLSFLLLRQGLCQPQTHGVKGDLNFWALASTSWGLGLKSVPQYSLLCELTKLHSKNFQFSYLCIVCLVGYFEMLGIDARDCCKLCKFSAPTLYL